MCLCPRFVLVGLLCLALVPSARGGEFNPQEVGMVVENWLVDTDATIIGLLNKQAGNTHGYTTFNYRSALIGPPAEALPTVPLASREEWQVWRGETRASISGDDYVIDYKGFMFDTRASAADEPTYDIRWESTWFKNDPSRTTPYATGDGAFDFVDPDFNFDITVDPSNPSNVTLSGGASAQLWGVVTLSISGSKNFSTGILTASAGASVDIPVVSDILGPVAEGKFTFEYNQKTGKYSSKVSGTALYIFSAEATVNSGRIAAPAKKEVVMPPIMPPVVRYRPVNVGKADAIKMNGGLGANPVPPGYLVPPVFSPFTPEFTSDPYNPFGALAETVMAQNPAFNNQVTNPSDMFESLLVHPGFIDPITFPDDDDPGILPGGGLGFSFMDPLDPFNISPPGQLPPGITIAPIQAVPEPSAAKMAVLFIALGAAMEFARRIRTGQNKNRRLPIATGLVPKAHVLQEMFFK